MDKSKPEIKRDLETELAITEMFIEKFKKHNKQLEKMVLDLILAHRITIQTLFRNEIKMTMSSHGVISAQDRRVAQVRSDFENYAKNKPDLLKEFEQVEKLGN